MPTYEVRFLNFKERVLGREVFIATDDDAAIIHVNKVLRSPFGRGHEIWWGEQLVHREEY